MSSKKKEVKHSTARTEYRRGKSKPRHKFTNDELKRLEQEFKCTPYPDFTTREELSQQFRCPLDVIDNWFQNKRARTQELKDTFSAIRRMRKSGDYKLIGHQDTQVQASNFDPGQMSYAQVAPGGLALCFMRTKEASGEQYGSCDYVVQSVGMRSSGTVANPPLVSAEHYMGDQPEMQESQYSTFSPADCVPCMQGQRQMDYTYSPMFSGQQNNWEYQQQLWHLQSYQERACLADWLIVHQSHRDLGQQVLSSFPSEHQGQFAPSNGDAADSFCKQPSGFHQMPLRLHGQQGSADSCTV